MSTREVGRTTLPRELAPTLPATAGDALAWRPAVLAMLLLATLIPRVWAACHWDVLWADTLRYVYASDALRRGDTHEALAEFGLNVYPVILCGLRQLSPDWETTGKWWSVVMATLTIFPLWGWTRRMFDDRVAAVAGLCYAFHGKLIAISPLMIRDATFIFFATLTLYLLWRAASEARLVFYLMAGVMLALAIHTRTEGWVLCVPVVGWSAMRAWNVRQDRWRVTLGAALCLSCVPGAVAVVNLAWLRDDPHWELLRPGHTQIIGHFIDQWWPSPAAPSAAKPNASQQPIAAAKPVQVAQPASTAPAASLSKQISSRKLNVKLLELFAKSLTWVGGVLAAIGLLAAWRTLVRPEHLVLAAMNLLLLALIRIRFAQGLEIRYFLLISIVAVTWMALGCLQVYSWTESLIATYGPTNSFKKVIVAAVIGVVAASLSMIDGPLGSERMMRRHAAIGRWIRDTYGSDAAVAGNIDGTSLTRYYSRCRLVQTFYWNDCVRDPMPTAISERLVDVIVLWRDDVTLDGVPNVVAQRIVADHGYRYLEPRELPLDPRESKEMIFVRAKP